MPADQISKIIREERDWKWFGADYFFDQSIKRVRKLYSATTERFKPITVILRKTKKPKKNKFLYFLLFIEWASFSIF